MQAGPSRKCPKRPLRRLYDALSSLSSSRSAFPTDARATRARKRVSASDWASTTVDSSSNYGKTSERSEQGYIYELVHTDATVLGQQPKPFMLVIRQTDRQGSHLNFLLQPVGWRHDLKARETQFGTLKILHIMGDDRRRPLDWSTLDPIFHC